MKKKFDNDGTYLEMLADSKCQFAQSIIDCSGKSIYDLRLYWSYDQDVEDALESNKIYQSKDVRSVLEFTLRDLGKDCVQNICDDAKIGSYIVVPLKNNGVHFGSLIVLSNRAEMTEAESTFLGLFAKQIELAITIASLFQTVKEQAVTDSLTGLNNRRYFEEEAQKEVLRAARNNQKFTIIGLDLDHLKHINDTYGHSCGDIAIRTIADVLKTNARSIDIPARMGGEEFNILLPGVDSTGGKIAAERIRKAIEAVEIEVIGHITASIGVATFGEHSDNLNELLELTDFAMYTSKKNGRNRVTVANPKTIDSWQDVALNSLKEILKNKNIPIDDNKLAQMRALLEDKPKNDNDSIYTLSDMLTGSYNPNHRNGSTKDKIMLANLLAKRFELSKDDVDNLKVAILLYDIGNIMIPKELLQKRTPLTDEEKDVIKKHPIIAAREILEPISSVNSIIPIIEHHHENWDGTGYPYKTAGHNIPICSQIVLVIDAYFALIEPRPFRQAMTKEEAIEIIQNGTDKKWNSKIVKEFISILNTDAEL
jgi:diguanylate cyclase (GGDEF)-like protein